MRADRDIMRFVMERTNELPGLQNHRDLIIQEVPKLSAGMFRYAALLLDQLNRPSRISISDMIRSPPSGLYEMYEFVLLRLEQDNRYHEFRKTIFFWVVMAKRPLSVRVVVRMHCS
jgi:hypothetical protein